MVLYVKLPCGTTKSVGLLDLDTIADVKNKIQDMENIPPDQQWLFYNGSELMDGLTIQNYNIPDESALELKG